ncbi:IRC5 [Candida pseudojiufengensis]|uniref:IRC5 n=1 Tax=Candida pseudojiufengensis TaxID=497109 RepID=UPI0022250DA3|nr:IRC5 [Candida pseudojiufengensis]KAI5959634.1 IRC5 [Candida pseudojiufengensis]
MTTAAIEVTSSDEENLNDTTANTSVSSLEELIKSQQKDGQQSNEEQEEFNQLSKSDKFNRLNILIEKSQVYSQIIADNILQSSLNQKEETQKETKSSPSKKKRKTNDFTKKSRISNDTATARAALEKAQTTHSISQPALVSGGQLKDYQLDGLEWLVTLYQNGLNGILADEMGLGKTLQCISFLAYLIGNGLNGPFLIVVPLSTLSNWYNEIKRFTPDVNVLMYTGIKQDRANIDLNQYKNYIILTSYEISIKDYNKFANISWEYLIVDEGHRLKNSQCLLIRFLKKLEVKNRLLLTGTPLQNNLNELWSLLNFILPDIFHDLELFQQWFNFDQLTNYEQDEEDEKTKKLIKLNIQETLIKNLHTILKPFILRRLKRDVVKDLPPKKEYLIHIPLSELQKKIYRDALNHNLQKGLIESNLKEFLEYNHKKLFENYDVDNFLKSVNEFKPKKRGRVDYSEALSDDEFDDSAASILYGDHNQKPKISYEDALKQAKKISNVKEKQEFLINHIYRQIINHVNHLKLQSLKLVQLRNICNSPYLYYEPFPIDGSKDNEFIEKLVQNSCKIKALSQILPKLLKNGNKCLIFCQFTRVMDLVQDWLISENIKTCRLDGSTSQMERQDQINEFNKKNSSFKVFLLSTRAGGLGINLTAADTVILFDSDWNPQMDLQAIDRVHRIGQTKPVKIYRFVVRNSIEEILLTKSSSKRFLEKLVIQMGGFQFDKLKKAFKNGEEKDDDNDEDMSVSELIELSKHNFLQNNNKEKNDQDHEKTNDTLLTPLEYKELFDRSDECYRKIADEKFDNITVFETTNNSES